MKRRVKKLIAMLLCVVMTAAFVPAFAVGAESTTVYTSAAGQVSDGIYSLPKIITEGTATIDFDIVFNTDQCNTLIGFNAKSDMTTDAYFSNSQVMLRVFFGNLNGRNGDTTIEGYDYTVGENYHIYNKNRYGQCNMERDDLRFGGHCALYI